MKSDKQQFPPAQYLPEIKRVVLTIYTVLVALILLSPFLLIFYFFAGFWFFACNSTPLKTWTNLDGLDFAYIQVDCDTLAKELTHELQVGVHRLHWRETVFVVEPADFNLVPSIAVEDGAIVVDLSAVDDIILAKNEWRGRRIRYHIGHIKYPNGLTPDDLKLHLK